MYFRAYDRALSSLEGRIIKAGFPYPGPVPESIRKNPWILNADLSLGDVAAARSAPLEARYLSGVRVITSERKGKPIRLLGLYADDPVPRSPPVLISVYHDGAGQLAHEHAAYTAFFMAALLFSWFAFMHPDTVAALRGLSFEGWLKALATFLGVPFVIGFITKRIRYNQFLNRLNIP